MKTKLTGVKFGYCVQNFLSPQPIPKQANQDQENQNYATDQQSFQEEWRICVEHVYRFCDCTAALFDFLRWEKYY